MRKLTGKGLIYGFMGLIVVFTSQCKLEQEKVSGNMTILCTTTIAADAVSNVVGDVSTVQILMGPGVDPHEYVPRQGDTKKMSDADVIVYHGLHLESKMTTHIDGLRKKKKHVINLGEGVDHADLIHNLEGHHHHHGEADHSHAGGIDPHVWNSIDIWIKCVQHLVSKLSSIQPENKDAFEKNGAEYIDKLEALKIEIGNMYDEIPESQRILVTSHDAFAYLARAHNLSTKSLQGISTAAEFGIKDVTTLADYMVSKNVKTIFLETSVPNKNLEAVINNCESNGHTVNIGGILYSDALGSAASNSETYIKMMRKNAETIVNGLK